jgi:hypothetical protein
LKTGWATGPGRSKGGIEAEPGGGSRDSGIADRPAAADERGIAAARMPALVDRAVGWTERVLPGVWADQVSRWCLIAVVAFFWLAVTLGAPLLLIPLVGAGVGLWKRRDHRAAAASELSDPDFL